LLAAAEAQVFAAPPPAAPAPVVSAPRTTAAAPPAAPPPPAAQAPAAAAAPAADAAKSASADAAKAGKEAGSILRVDSKRIDDLLNLVSETVITKATFNQITGEFNDLVNQLHGIETSYREKIKNLFDSLPDYLESIQEGRSIKDIRKEIGGQYGDIFSLFDGFEANLKSNVGKFRSTSQNLGRITAELQEGVMRIRMVPISQIFSRFPRLVRDLSKSLNKKINLVIEGEDTELDKSVIEDLLDPIMHSVRNSVDHGIESAEERKVAGKPEEGRVLLKAANEGNMIVIEIADDGKGIDVESVKAKAIERGLISPGKVLSDVEAFNLIFEPGFSTAKQVTSISGRGVGLDVVRRSIEKLNGTVTVNSERGNGTRFTIKLPLTLAIIQGLLVRVGAEIYSIPITSVIESLRIKPDEIKFIDNYEVINVRNDVISLLRLNRLFGIRTEEQTEFHFVVIVGTAEKKMGFMVDSLIGEEDVVIKPLRDQFTNSPGIAGASILGDGSVSLIIDVSQLLELGQKKEAEQRRIREGVR
jgi:two-component system chemotaxis sensor kinase CheA